MSKTAAAMTCNIRLTDLNEIIPIYLTLPTYDLLTASRRGALKENQKWDRLLIELLRFLPFRHRWRRQAHSIVANRSAFFVISDLTRMRRARDEVRERSAQTLRVHVLLKQRCEQSAIGIAVNRI
jgi:hypothetical protein